MVKHERSQLGLLKILMASWSSLKRLLGSSGAAMLFELRAFLQSSVEKRPVLTLHKYSPHEYGKMGSLDPSSLIRRYKHTLPAITLDGRAYLKARRSRRRIPNQLTSKSNFSHDHVPPRTHRNPPDQLHPRSTVPSFTPFQLPLVRLPLPPPAQIGPASCSQDISHTKTSHSSSCPFPANKRHDTSLLCVVYPQHHYHDCSNWVYWRNGCARCCCRCCRDIVLRSLEGTGISPTPHIKH
jgi:hypothetical protein